MKKNSSSIQIFIFLIVVFGFVASIYGPKDSNENDLVEVPRQTKTLTLTTGEEWNLSDEVLDTFIESNNIKSFITTVLNREGKYPIVNKLIAARINTIQGRYPLSKLEVKFHRQNRIDSGSGINFTSCNVGDDGVPFIRIREAKLLQMWADISGSVEKSLRHETFFNSITVGLVHELDHLAYADVIDSSRTDEFEYHVEHEKVAWSHTVQLINWMRKEGHPLQVGLVRMLESWQSCKDAPNPEAKWEEIIRKQYQSKKRALE